MNKNEIRAITQLAKKYLVDVQKQYENGTKDIYIMSVFCLTDVKMM